MFQEVLNSYRQALRRAVPLLTVHIFVRLVSAAILVPVIGGLLAVTLSFSDQSALTDQDIARFLLTPAGAVGALLIGSLILVAAVIDVAVMTAVLRSQASGPGASLKSALGFLVQALPRLIRFAVSFLVRVLAIALPFLAIGAGAAALLLREFDINYYLAFRPPAFTTVLVIGGASAAVLAGILLERLTAWAIALHLSVFDLAAPQDAFARSRQNMQGHRWALLRRVLMWMALRFGAASVLVAVAGVFLAELPQLFDENLRLFFAVTAVLLLLWVALNTALNAIANGALSHILNSDFDRSLNGRPARAEAARPSIASRYVMVPLLVAAFSLGSLAIGAALSDRIGGVENVDVIGHRGAAASRPENTLASVNKAVEDGADWVEIDVQETADGEILVVHDSDFMKSAGVSTKVWDVTMQDVAEIDIGSWYDPIYADARAPLLRDVLAAVKGRAKLIIELKYYGHDVDLENRVIALVEAAGMQDQIATMSLKYPAVQKMRMLRPEWRHGILAATAVGNLAGLEGDFLAVSSGSVSTRLMSRAAAAGKDVYAWTVNDAALMSRMISLGVDGLITDEPKLAGEVIAYYETLSTAERLLLRLGDSIGFAFDFTPAVQEEI